MRQILLLGSLALSACATAAPPPPAPPPVQSSSPGQTCSSANLQQFVGQVKSADLESRLLQVSGASTIRWVPQGTAVTMIFEAGRLTVFLDAQSRVERLGCS